MTAGRETADGDPRGVDMPLPGFAADQLECFFGIVERTGKRRLVVQGVAQDKSLVAFRQKGHGNRFRFTVRAKAVAASRED